MSLKPCFVVTFLQIFINIQIPFLLYLKIYRDRERTLISYFVKMLDNLISLTYVEAIDIYTFVYIYIEFYHVLDEIDGSKLKF